MDKRKLKDFAVEEIAKDPLETAVFRSHMQLENARLPIIVILDKSIYGIVRLLVAQSAKKKNNEKALEELMNKFNKQYKAFKYYLDDEGNLVLDLSILCPEKSKRPDDLCPLPERRRTPQDRLSAVDENHLEVIHTGDSTKEGRGGPGLLWKWEEPW